MERRPPNLWGLSTTQLHDRFWASRGVQVVRQGERSEIVEGAELFLLMDPRSLAIFKLARLVDLLCWLKPDVLFVRLHDERERGYRERVLTDHDDRFVGFERVYGGSDSRLARVALTRDADLALDWQTAPNPRAGWKRLRQQVPRSYRAATSLNGTVYDRSRDEELAQFAKELVGVWARPDVTISRVIPAPGNAWADREAKVDPAIQCVGPVWIGAGRSLQGGTNVVGPAVLWDDPSARPAVAKIDWGEIEPTQVPERPVRLRQISSFGRAGKRLFDIVAALVALVLTLPFYPLIMLAIWLEDGRPFFFAHRRETVGGREFACLKFRSMRKDADEIKRRLAAQNQADGPQFFMTEDPRLTRVGIFLRKANLDELPQFFNVLLGQMSLVGPRPSPREENQFCPPWREARLSVRPGITGLWQVKRTRRVGMDFQEWIKYDIEYVENASWRLDVSIIWQTVVSVFRGIIRS